MALREYRNTETGATKASLKKLSEPWEEVLVAPAAKFMEAANKATGTSRLKGAEAILRKRAREHSRDVEIDDNIQFNKANGLDEQVATAFLNENGQKRRAIDDL